MDSFLTKQLSKKTTQSLFMCLRTLTAFQQSDTFTKRWAFLHIKTWTHGFGVVCYTNEWFKKGASPRGPFQLLQKDSVVATRDCSDLPEHLFCLFLKKGYGGAVAI